MKFWKWAWWMLDEVKLDREKVGQGRADLSFLHLFVLFEPAVD